MALMVHSSCRSYQHPKLQALFSGPSPPGIADVLGKEPLHEDDEIDTVIPWVVCVLAPAE